MFRTASTCSDFSGWRAGQVDRFCVLCPNGKMLTKQQVLRKVRSPVGIDFQCIQVKSLTSKLQRHEIFNGSLLEFEKLLIQHNKRLMSTLYELFIAKNECN